jgi:hypothetical protein
MARIATIPIKLTSLGVIVSVDTIAARSFPRGAAKVKGKDVDGALFFWPERQ